MNQANFFDFQDIIFNEIIGDTWLTVFIGLLAIIFFGLKCKIPAEAITSLCLVWIMAVYATYTGMTILWIAAVLIAGISCFIAIAKAINR